MAALSAMARPVSSSFELSTPVGGVMEMPANRLVGILGHETSVAVLTSGRCSLAGVGVPDGWHERASLVLFFTRTILKR